MDKYIYIGLKDGRISAACANIAPDRDALADYFLALATEGGFTSEESQSQARVMADAMASQLLAKSQEAIRVRKQRLRESLRASLSSAWDDC